MDYAKESLRLHGDWKGKIEVVTRVPVENKDDLSLAYTPGVAQPCLEIQKDINKSYELTRRWNMCLVVTDGSAVLGLGDIGPEAGMPVMEGKCVLFKAFGDVDAFPLCIKSHDVDEIVNTIYMISGSFGGVNLEDISAPRCFEIEKKLKEKCDIPIFHDDQHGTAVITLAGVINFKTSRCGNILKIDSSKGSCQEAYCLNDLINIFTADAERNRVYTAKFFKEYTFAFHNRHTCFRSDISQSKYRGSVCYNSNCIPASCQIIALVYILLDLQTRLSNTRCVSKA